MGEDLENIGKLKADEYWEWRTSVAEWKKGEEELKNRQLLQALMEKDLEINRLRIQLFKTQSEDHKGKVSQLKQEYEDTKARLEKKHKVSLNDCIIGEDFTISKLVKTPD